jgi:hypothetical protein
MKKVLFALTVVSLVATSCATIFTGTRDRISFNTSVPGAKILIDGAELCTTPCTERISRKLGETEVQVKLDGYETKLIRLDKSFNVVSVLNLGNLLGWGIDVISGAVMPYGKKSYDIQMTKLNGTAKINPNKIEIDTKSNTAVLYVIE